MTVHFHSSDSRFCGSMQQGRAFTFEPNDVTCRSCQEQDAFELSKEAESLLASLGEPA